MTPLQFMLRMTMVQTCEHHIGFLDEAKALEAQKRAEEALRNATDKQEIATLQAEFGMMAAQLAAIRKLRRK